VEIVQKISIFSFRGISGGLIYRLESEKAGLASKFSPNLEPKSIELSQRLISVEASCVRVQPGLGIVMSIHDGIQVV
jgi:hypothetical protein